MEPFSTEEVAEIEAGTDERDEKTLVDNVKVRTLHYT